MKKVLVLGSYGGAGRAVLDRLCKLDGCQIVAAGRSAKKVQSLAEVHPGIDPRRLDAADEGALAGLIAEVDLVVNCIGPYLELGAAIARVAVRCGVPVFDLASEQEHYRRLLRLDGECLKRGVLLLTGLGAYPGVSGILLRHLLDRHPDATSGQMALVTGHPAEGTTGRAQLISGLLELPYRHESLEGGALRVRLPAGMKEVTFPEPFGTIPLMQWPQLEVLAAARAHQLQDLTTWVALDGQPPTPRMLLRLVWLLKPRPRSRLLDVIEQCARARQLPPVSTRERASLDHGALRVSVESEDRRSSVSLVVGDINAATSWLPAYAVERWLKKGLTSPGVSVPMDVLDPEPAIDEIRKLPELIGYRESDGAT